MRRIIFTLVIALSATAMWAQKDRTGVTMSYMENGVQKELTYRMDSVNSWGRDPSDYMFFVQPLIGAKFSVTAQNFISFTYPPIAPDHDNTGTEYLVVNVSGQKAAFLLDENFEMTWKGGVLALKNKTQSQTIGLRNGISFTYEKLSSGYTNPNISATPAQGTWYLVMGFLLYDDMFGDTIQILTSYDDECSGSYGLVTFVADGSKKPRVIMKCDCSSDELFIPLGHNESDGIQTGQFYISNTFVGFNACDD